jgi:hypothetical protein
MWDPQLRPLRPGASLAGAFTYLSMTVFVGRSLKDRPAAPCLSKKHTTEHPTTFFALSRQGLTHTHTFFPQAASFYTHLFHRLPFKGKTLSPTHTHPFHTQHFHTQLCHTQLCHTQTCDTQLGHTNLSHTHTRNSFTYNF